MRSKESVLPPDHPDYLSPKEIENFGKTPEDHIGCWSYPNCDIAPQGCCFSDHFIDDPVGHRG
jgi:hypothetical protein